MNGRTSSPLFLSSWDIRRAFDSVSKEAMDASWRRLGVPAHTAHWMAHLDDNGPTAIRSPWALEAWQCAGRLGFGATPSTTLPCTFTRERGTPQGDVSSRTAFFDIALRALADTDPATHFRMPTTTSDSALVSDLDYADDLVSLSSSLDGLQHKADLMSAVALLFDLTISAPKLRAVCLGPPPPQPTLTIYGPGWTPTIIPVRSQGSVTILGLTIDHSPTQITQPQRTREHLIQAATILGHQRVADTTALVASVSRHTPLNSFHGLPRNYKRSTCLSTGPSAVSCNFRLPTRTLCSPLPQYGGRGTWTPAAFRPSQLPEMVPAQPTQTTGGPPGSSSGRPTHSRRGGLRRPLPHTPAWGLHRTVHPHPGLGEQPRSVRSG